MSLLTVTQITVPANTFGNQNAVALAINPTAQQVGLPPQQVLQAQASNILGFRAYNNLASKRNIALTHPDVYLNVKRLKVVGGDIPAGAITAQNVAAYQALLPGVAGIQANNVNAIPIAHSIKDDVAELYANTLTNMYNAGLDEKSASDYARQLAQVLSDSRFAQLELEMPDYYGTGAEREVFTSTLTGATPEKLLASRALTSIQAPSRPRAITEK